MECGGMGRCALSSPARSRPSYQRLPQVRSLNPNPRFQSFLHAQERVPEQYLLPRSTAPLLFLLHSRTHSMDFKDSKLSLV